MIFKNTLLVFTLFITLFTGGKTYADGRLVYPNLVWQGGEGSLNFHGVDSYTLVSDDGEYAIILEPQGDHRIENSRLIAMKISLGSKNGFSSYLQQKYAFVPVPFSVTVGETIYASIDSKNQLILTSNHGLTEYINGTFPLTHVKRDSPLKIINESSLDFDNDLNKVLQITNGLKLNLKSTQNKHTIVFEDKGWNTFQPEEQDISPLRTIKVWLETESLSDPTERYKRLYAVIEYSYSEAAVDDKGSYLIDLPVELLIGVNKQLYITVNPYISYVWYPFGSITLD